MKRLGDVRDAAGASSCLARLRGAAWAVLSRQYRLASDAAVGARGSVDPSRSRGSTMAGCCSCSVDDALQGEDEHRDNPRLEHDISLFHGFHVAERRTSCSACPPAAGPGPSRSLHAAEPPHGPLSPAVDKSPRIHMLRRQPCGGPCPPPCRPRAPHKFTRDAGWKGGPRRSGAPRGAPRCSEGATATAPSLLLPPWRAVVRHTWSTARRWPFLLLMRR